MNKITNKYKISVAINKYKPCEKDGWNNSGLFF